MTPITKPGEADLTAAAEAARHAYFGPGRHGKIPFSSIATESQQRWLEVAAAAIAALGTAPATPVPAPRSVTAAEHDVLMAAARDSATLVAKGRLVQPAPAPATQADAAEVGRKS